MVQIGSFLNNQIVVNLVAPLIVAAIIGIWQIILKKMKKRRVGMLLLAHKKKSVDVLNAYCERNRIKPIVSFGDRDALKIISEFEKGIIVKAAINFGKKLKDNDMRNFVIILIKYVPKCNMSYFYKNGYSFSFEIKSPDGIQGVNFEIKDITGAKVIDEFLVVTENVKRYSFYLQDYYLKESWKEISEICFTVFGERQYITKNNAKLEISHCTLEIIK